MRCLLYWNPCRERSIWAQRWARISENTLDVNISLTEFGALSGAITSIYYMVGRLIIDPRIDKKFAEQNTMLLATLASKEDLKLCQKSIDDAHERVNILSNMMIGKRQRNEIKRSKTIS